jgi:8-amino-7-oxononanoate synthase
MYSLCELISSKLEENKKRGLYRKIPSIASINTGFEKYSTKTAGDKKNCGAAVVNLATNDYLWLSKNERVRNAAKKAIELYGTSASSSFLICGHYDVHKKLEEELCRLKGSYEECILYPSGYQANTGIIRSLSNIAPLKTFITFDELSHASIIDGILSAGVKFKSFRHNDLKHLENIMNIHKDYEIKLIITEGVFSMDGDIPDLPGILDIAKQYGALSIIDDAHATGTIGEKGGGSADFHKIKPDIIIGTLGKALASSGAFAVSNRPIIEYLINFSRAFIFSTGIPPSSAASALEALNIIKENPDITETLKNNSAFARKFLKESGVDTLNSSTHIIPLLIGDEKKAVSAEQKLLEKGIYLKAVRYPAVPKKSARLRFSVNLGVNKKDLENILKKISDVIN